MRISTGGGPVHSHHLLRDYRWAVFCPEGYVSECDIDELERVLPYLGMNNLFGILSPMNRKNYVYDFYHKEHCKLLANGIRDAVESVKVKSIFSDIGGWQMLKPTEGVDKTMTLYTVRYCDDGWFKIFSPNGKDSVYVQAGYVGKYFNTQIIGVKNQKMGVNIHDTHYDKRYDKKIVGLIPSDQYMFLTFLGPIVYKEAGKKSFMTHEDFNKVKEIVVAKEQAFVHEFYDYLIGSHNDTKKVRRKYFYSMAQRFIEMIDNRRHDGVRNVDMFLPCSYDDFKAKGYKVSYLGKDCFEVSAGGNSLYLKVVLYGNKQTPAIMGMRNPNQGIDYCPDRFKWFDYDAKR